MATPGLMQEAALYGIGKIKTIGVSMRKYTKTDCYKRSFLRWWHRHYKGLSDLLALIFFGVGLILTAIGAFMTLIGNYGAVLDISMGFMLLVASSDLWQYGRRKT